MKKFLKIVVGTMWTIIACFLVSCNFNINVFGNNSTTNNGLGVFYTLKDAYSKGLLKDNDLIEIADFYQENESMDRKMSNSVNLLDEETKKEIKNSYLFYILKDDAISDKYVNIYAYYGAYNGTIAIGVTDNYNVYDKIIIPEYKVGNVIFYNYAESDIRIWVKL